MKKVIYTILLLVIAVTLGCKSNDSNLSIRVKDTETEYTYNAVYPVSKTDELEKYIARELKNELRMDQNIDTKVSLLKGEEFRMKATEGALQIQLDKRNSSMTGFIKLKKFTDGISAVLGSK